VIASSKKKTNNDNNISTRLKYADYARRSKYSNVYEGVPTYIVTTNVNSNSERITFIPPGNPSMILITLINTNDSTEVHTYYIKTNNYIMGNLKKNTTYDLYITSYYISGSEYSTSVMKAFTTLDESAPINPFFDINSCTNKSLTVIFSSAAGAVSYYSIAITNVQQNSVAYFKGINSPYTITDLSINTIYDVVVTSHYKDSKNTYSADTITNTTYNEDSPYDVQISNLSSNSVKINYNVIGNPYYTKIFLYDSNDNSSTYLFTAVSTDISYTFINITRGITYNVNLTTGYSHPGYSDLAYSTFIPNAFTT
jgi:hypothetical protein